MPFNGYDGVNWQIHLSKGVENLSKYKDLEIQVLKSLRLKTKTILLVGALGMIKKGTNKLTTIDETQLM